jgi:hypothetical protein
MAQQHGCAGISGHWPQEPARARLHPLRRQLTLMKNHPSDAADALSRNSLYACARARLMGCFDKPCRLRQTKSKKGLTHMNTTILALDLGTTTGWALHHWTAHHQRHRSFKPQRFEGGGMRFLRFKRWLNESSGQRLHQRGVLRGSAPPRSSMPHTPTAASWATSPRGASTTTSRTRACRSARSRSTRPAKAMQARTR